MQHGAQRTERQPARRLVDGPFLVLLALCTGAGGAVLWLKGPEAFVHALTLNLGLTLELVPKILAGVFVASALPFLLPRDRVLRVIGPESGLRGLAVAALAGAVFPGGPAVTYPLTVGLMAAGADLGAGVALVTGWVLLGLNRTIIWELSFLPAPFVALRVALSLPAPIVFGLIVRRAMARAAR